MLARTCCQPTWRTRGFPAPVSLPPANQGLLRFAMPKPSNYRYAVKAAASFHSLHAVQSASRLDPRWAAGMPPLRTRHAPVALNALLPQGGAKRFWSAAASAAALNTLPLRPPHMSTAKAVPEGTRTPKALRAANPPYPLCEIRWNEVWLSCCDGQFPINPSTHQPITPSPHHPINPLPPPESQLCQFSAPRRRHPAPRMQPRGRGWSSACCAARWCGSY